MITVINMHEYNINWISKALVLEKEHQKILYLPVNLPKIRINKRKKDVFSACMTRLRWQYISSFSEKLSLTIN